jgi:hypothetical protein
MIDNINNVRIVVSAMGANFHAELQVRLCNDHWSTIKTVTWGKDKNAVMERAAEAMDKLRKRAEKDVAIKLDDRPHFFVAMEVVE